MRLVLMLLTLLLAAPLLPAADKSDKPEKKEKSEKADKAKSKEKAKDKDKKDKDKEKDKKDKKKDEDKDKKKDEAISPIAGLTRIQAQDRQQDAERRLRITYNSIKYQYGLLRERHHRIDVEKNPALKSRQERYASSMAELAKRIEKAASAIDDGLTGEAAEQARLLILPKKLEYLKMLEIGKDKLSDKDREAIKKEVEKQKKGASDAAPGPGAVAGPGAAEGPGAE